jgi:hypothetical protein
MESSMPAPTTRVTTTRVLALAAIAGLAMAAPSSAHHSTAMFKWGEELPLKGAVVERWEWTNPHTFLYVKVKGADGKERRWAFEGMSPNHLVRYGWTRTALKPGDVIDLTYYPLRDTRPGGFNVTVTRPGGTKLNQFRKE